MKLRRTRAFTLLEVLIALGIFGSAAVVLAGAYINVLNGYEVARRATLGEPELQFARAQLLSQPDIDLARQGGDFEAADNRRVRWTADIQPTNEADLFQVIFTCEIDGTGQARPQTVQQTFRVLRPTWSVATERATLRAASKDRILKILEGVNQ